MYGDSVNNNERVKRVLDQLDGNGDGNVSREEWLLFNKSQPLLLFPAYQMQEALRSKIIGTGWWQAMQEKRTAQFRQQVRYSAIGGGGGVSLPLPLLYILYHLVTLSSHHVPSRNTIVCRTSSRFWNR